MLIIEGYRWYEFCDFSLDIRHPSVLKSEIILLFYHLFDKSLQEPYLPICWKFSCVTAVHKKEDTTLHRNYHLFSLTSTFCSSNGFFAMCNMHCNIDFVVGDQYFLNQLLRKIYQTNCFFCNESYIGHKIFW